MKSKITFHRNCVFQMTFENGFTISLSSTGGGYSSNRYTHYNEISPNRNEVETIEVACWDENDDGILVPLSTSDDVLGYINTDQVASIIAVIAKAQNKDEIIEGVTQLGIK